MAVLSKVFRRKEKNIVIDFSGHGETKIDVENIADPFSVLKEAERLLQIIIANPAWHAASSAGKTTIILPGLSQLSATFLAIYHGVYGHFPTITWYIRTDEGFKVIDKNLDLLLVRNNARRELR